MVGYFDFRVAGRLHLYFRSWQVMPQYFFALTLPIQLPPATIIHGAEARRTLPVKHGMRFLSLLPLMTFLRFLAGRQARVLARARRQQIPRWVPTRVCARGSHRGARAARPPVSYANRSSTHQLW